MPSIRPTPKCTPVNLSTHRPFNNNNNNNNNNIINNAHQWVASHSPKEACHRPAIPDLRDMALHLLDMVARLLHILVDMRLISLLPLVFLSPRCPHLDSEVLR